MTKQENTMIKKIYTLFVFSFISMTSLGIATNTLINQLSHIQAQKKAIILSWQRAEATLQSAKKLLTSELYQRAENIAQRILTLADVNSKKKTLSDQQLEAIISQKPYEAINFLSDYFPDILKNLNQPMRIVCIAMGNKAYRLLLGQKLTIKEKELLMAITEAKKRE